MASAWASRPRSYWPHPSAPDPVPAFSREQQDEPVRAMKAAWLIVQPDGPAFSPLTCPDRSRWYGPQAVAECHCMGTLGILPASGCLASIYGLDVAESHARPGPRTSCGFYAWKPDVPFPWQVGTWLLRKPTCTAR